MPVHQQQDVVFDFSNKASSRLRAQMAFLNAQRIAKDNERLVEKIKRQSQIRREQFANSKSDSNPWYKLPDGNSSDG